MKNKFSITEKTKYAVADGCPFNFKPPKYCKYTKRFLQSQIILTIITGLYFSSISFAGPGLPGHRHAHSHEDARGHDKPIDKQHAIEMAAEVVTKLANLKKIHSSWIKVDADDAKKKSYPSGLEWVVTFKNPKISNKHKRVLFIFFTLNGKYIAANYTGN